MSTVIRLENISKQYRLGSVSTGSFVHDLNRAWHRIHGKEDPYLKIGEQNNRTAKGGSEYVWALKDISFDVQHGEVLGIIGRNGAGKSTLLKILSRTTAPTTGKIKIKGRIASLLEVGTGFHPELSGRENIYLNGAILGMTKKEIRSKFDEIVDFAGIERYIDTPVKRYSSGMYVRLAFAVAAHLEPEILIVDEVLAVGDAEFQKKALGKMKDVSKNEGRTVLFVSHNLGSIKQLCNRGLLMDNGRITISGSINEAVNSYISFYNSNLSNLNNGFIDLSMHPNKVNKDEGIFSAQLMSNGFPVSSVNPGDDFTLLIKYRTTRKVTYPELGIVIKDNEQRALIGLNNNFTGQKIDITSEGEDQLRIVIPSLNIYLAGEYTVNLYFALADNDYECLYEAFKFKISEFDVYNSGKLLSSEWNLIYYPDIKFENVD
ncbi:MAG TPA: ABC transporter ATP-binding protein [Flavisolibacter sp.]|nr:ABC transporter ATP-binding protein [Flavisolibacter sp.]